MKTLNILLDGCCITNLPINLLACIIAIMAITLVQTSPIIDTLISMTLLFSAHHWYHVISTLGPPEYFTLNLTGLIILLKLTSSSLKSSLMAMIGLILSTIGLDNLFAVNRFSYSFNELNHALTLTIIILGMFVLGKLLTAMISNAPLFPASIPYLNSTLIRNLLRRFILPLLVVLTLTYAYASTNSIFALLLTVFYGVISFSLNRAGLKPTPLIMGLAIGPELERSLIQSLVINNGSITKVVMPSLYITVLVFSASLILYTLFISANNN